MNRALNFPGSQVALWHYDGDDIVCELVEAENHGSMFAYVIARFLDGNLAAFMANEVTPIGPVARAMMGSQ